MCGCCCFLVQLTGCGIRGNVHCYSENCKLVLLYIKKIICTGKLLAKLIMLLFYRIHELNCSKDRDVKLGGGGRGKKEKDYSQ